MERCLRRLEARTMLREVSFELGSRIWASRASYADDLVALFATSRMRVTFVSAAERATLRNIMKAKKKPLTKLTPDDLGVDMTTTLEVLEVTEPPKRVGGAKVESVEEVR
ncbi:hypothetical protein HK405_009389 [Cladochytrium tenue]|nr:hypothetical protein HK405_009389 [Cladochytrium tenue]